MKKVLKLLLPYWRQLLLSIATTYVTVWSSLKLPTVMSNIVNKGIIGNDESYIFHQGLYMLLVTAIGSIAAITTGFLASRIATGFAKSLRDATFKKIESFSLTEINKFSVASLITRSTNDVQQIQQVIIMLIRIALQAPLMAVGAIFSALDSAPSMTWIMAFSIIALLILVGAIFVSVVPKFKVQQKLIDKLNLVARENLTGLRVIRAFNNENVEEKKFNDVNHDITNLNLWINRIISAMMPAMLMVINFTMLAIVWFGSHYIVNGNLEIGNMMAFMQYAMQVIMSFLLLVMIMVLLPRAQVSAERIGEILTTKNTIKEPSDPETLGDDAKGVVEFKDVTFSYPGAESPVLNDINFTAIPGQTTAFIGSTGSGKSTLINLIPRLYDVSAGQILIDEHDIRKLSHQELVKSIGFVPQRGVLFSGTVDSNVKYGAPGLADEEVHHALEVAQADFVYQLDDQTKYHIAQGGSNVSGGQKQRISIARALAKDPNILIFDDSFSALDYKTDAALRKSLAKEAKDKTVLIVAQRISTIRQADQIIVLENGQIAGRGTHQQLLNDSEVYREIASSQLSESELAKELKEAKHA